MEVEFVTAHSGFPPQRLCGLKTRRDLRAGSRPIAALAGAYAPCTNVFLLCRSRFNLRRLGHRAATTNESAQASLPNNWFKAARFVRWDRHSRALNQTLYVNTMTSTLKEKLLRLTGARYKHLLVAMSTFKESEDALGTLLRVHLTTESILEELIRLAFEEKSDAILSLDLRYHQKLELVSKLEIEEDWSLIPDYIVGSLRKLNKLRNQLAHSLDASITNSQVIELFIGAEQLYGDMSTASININLKRYAFFILGSMLPKFEKIDDSDSEQDV